MSSACRNLSLLGVIVCLSAISLSIPALAQPAPTSPFEVQELATGVWLFQPTEPAGAYTNSMVIERQDGLLVVDAQPSPAAARELLTAIHARTAKPVRYLVLSHSHAEASGGATAFPDDVLVIGSLGCHDALADSSYDFGAELRARSTDPTTWVEPSRRLPTLVLYGPTTLADPRNPVDLAPMQQGHSRGDLIVRLPAQSVFHVGGLLGEARNPYAGDADVGGWLAILNSLAKESPRVVVGLRGPAADMQAVRSLRDAFAWVRGQVENGFVEQWPHSEIPGRVVANPAAAKWFDVQATPSFFTLLVQRVLDESLEHRHKRGVR